MVAAAGELTALREHLLHAYACERALAAPAFKRDVNDVRAQQPSTVKESVVVQRCERRTVKHDVCVAHAACKAIDKIVELAAW